MQRSRSNGSDKSGAHFGLACAEYKVIDLPILEGAKLIIVPVCCDPKIYLTKSFCENPHYGKAVRAADQAATHGNSSQKDKFEGIGKRVLATQKIFKEEHKKGLNIKRNKKAYGYDIFLCVKVTEIEDQNRMTEDSTVALRLYDNLRQRGYRVFYSESAEGKKFLTAGNKDHDGYNARLTYALYSAKCLLVICGNKEYLETDYVKNEYTLYDYMIEQGYKSRGSIRIYSTSKDSVVDTLPGIGQLQVIVPDTGTQLRIQEFIEEFRDRNTERFVFPKKPEEMAQTDEEKVKEYMRAAKRGDANAQNNLGLCYENGEGVTKNIQEAIKWYKKAAEQGHQGAKAALERLKK